MVGQSKVPMTLSLPPEVKKELKLLAIERNMTVSDLVIEWLRKDTDDWDEKADA